MKPANGGRFCESCQERVIDLSDATTHRADAVSLLYASAKVCIRLRMEGADPVFREEPQLATARPARAIAAYVLAAAVSLSACQGHVESGQYASPAVAEMPQTPLVPSPDSDGDEVDDAHDVCPTVAAPNSLNGCEQMYLTGARAMPDPIFAPTLGFDDDSSQIAASQATVVEEIARLIKADPAIESVTSRAGTRGGELAAQRLAAARTAAIAQAVTKRGVPASRLRQEMTSGDSQVVEFFTVRRPVRP